MVLSELLTKLKSLNLPIGQYVIISSGVMAVREIREANDLDIVVTRSLWKKLVSKYNTEGTNHRLVIRPDPNIEILGPAYDPSQDLFDVDELVSDCEVINGVSYLKLETVKKIKEKMGRDKDLKDIELINQYLRTH